MIINQRMNSADIILKKFKSTEFLLLTKLKFKLKYAKAADITLMPTYFQVISSCENFVVLYLRN